MPRQERGMPQVDQAAAPADRLLNAREIAREIFRGTVSANGLSATWLRTGSSGSVTQRSAGGSATSSHGSSNSGPQHDTRTSDRLAARPDRRGDDRADPASARMGDELLTQRDGATAIEGLKLAQR